ncbi:hypothetical protein F2P56_013826 [Juglans regia]|uniref:Uncharacterized protein n=1 Tax=Juglans regia TaxID=51240 RepID=A0A833XC58_JUGRE|nr:hypothetical protein F2P56_013826 [Juglans regia]
MVGPTSKTGPVVVPHVDVKKKQWQQKLPDLHVQPVAPRAGGSQSEMVNFSGDAITQDYSAKDHIKHAHPSILFKKAFQNGKRLLGRLQNNSRKREWWNCDIKEVQDIPPSICRQQISVLMTEKCDIELSFCGLKHISYLSTLIILTKKVDFL